MKKGTGTGLKEIKPFNSAFNETEINHQKCMILHLNRNHSVNQCHNTVIPFVLYKLDYEGVELSKLQQNFAAGFQ